MSIFKKASDQEKAFVAADKTLLKEILHPLNDKLPLPYSLAHAVIQPREASVPHILLGSEVYYILNGVGIIFIDKESTEIKPGDIVYVPPKASQHVLNTGAVNLEFLCIVHPYWTPESDVLSS